MTDARKGDLRGHCKARLQAMSDVQQHDGACSVCSLLQSVLGEPAGGFLLGYLPLPGELNIEACLAWWLQRGGRLAAPVVDWSTGTMVAGALNGLDANCLRTGRHGVREPASGQVVPLKDLSMVLVPGLAFDPTGRRLGRGGGFYDRLLCALDDDVRRIGVCFDEQRVERVPVDTHDQSVDVVVSPAGTVACR